jgi:signal transduction histidine kinase
VEAREKYYFVILFLFTVLGLLGLYNLSFRPKLPIQTDETKAGLKIQLSNYNLPLEMINRTIIGAENWPVETIAQLDAVVELKEIGDEFALTLDDGKIYHFELVRRFNFPYLILFTILGISFYVIAGLVWHGSKHKGEKYFAVAATLLGYIIIMTWAGIKLPLYISGILILVYFLSYPQAFLTFLFFSYHFPAPTLSQQVLLGQKRIFQLIGISLSSLLIFLFFWQYFDFNLVNFERYQLGYRIFRIFLFVTLTFSVVVLVRNLKKAPNPVNRKKMLWVVWGVIWGSFPFVFLWNLPQIFKYQPLIPEWVFLIFILLTPASIAIAILRYRLFDIEIVISRSLVYFLVLVSLIAFYVVFIGSISLIFFQQFSLHRSPFLSITSAVLIGLMFNPMKSRVQTFVNKKFFRIRYDRFKSLQYFLQDLEVQTRKSDIIRNILYHYQAAVPLLTSCFILRENNHWEEVTGNTQEGKNLTHWVKENGNDLSLDPVVNNKFQDKVEPNLGFSYSDMPDDWILLFPVGENAFWALGPKLAQTKFWKEDIDLAGQMVKAASLQLEKLNYVEISLKASLEKEQAEKLSEWKTLLLTEVAHDLRAPLNTMLWKLKNFQMNLSQGEDLPDGESLQGIQKQIFRLQRLIQSLLTLSNIEQSTLKLQKDQIDVKECISLVLDNLTGIISEKKLHVEFECSETLCLYNDPILFEEIILNLLDNAIKYSPPEKTVHIFCEERMSTSAGEIFIKIRDEAGGIPEKILRESSQPFRSKKSTREGERGFYLGLYIIKEFTKILGGKIDFRSRKNVGTEVTLSFKYKNL